MKNGLVICFMAFFTMLSAQETVTKNVGEFSTLKVYDLINVTMIKSDKDEVVISGSNKHDVEFVNKNGTLKIRMDMEELYSGDNTKVTLYYTKVDVIDANEGADVNVQTPIDQYEIDLKTQEGGKIEAVLEVSYANIRAVTGGEISTSGTAKNQDISIYTGGIYNAKDLVTEYTEVRVQAAGEASINSVDKVDVRIRAGGDVYIYGTPKKVDESRVFGGRIKRMN